VATLPACLLLLAAESGVVDDLEGAVEGLLVVPGVVLEAPEDARVVGEVLRRDEVLAAISTGSSSSSRARRSTARSTV
jgi:hypothetical protein